ncbi:hypothetical protein HF325_000041 [Metschnikowia pulcherrima]|uniref:Uncharacterized protein n=1 Tax=Metschnikowia pulcherrima TaxID=27326 RepID=A0A8H7GVP2_9ASCO|nr:hypothetical protein HF325_000041 [Metschnikowia pulcherrima]
MTQHDLACALLRFLSEDSLPHGAAAALPKPGITSRASYHPIPLIQAHLNLQSTKKNSYTSRFYCQE